MHLYIVCIYIDFDPASKGGISKKKIETRLMYVCMRFSLGTFEQTNNLIIRQCSMRSRTHKHTYQHSIYAKRAKSIDSH